MPTPGVWQRQFFFSFKCFGPDTLHLGIYFTVTIFSHAATWSIAQCLRTGHRACHASGMQDALTAHATVPDGFLDRMFDEWEKFWTHLVYYAETKSRRFLISSFARRTAVDASAAYPSAPTASAYSCVTGAPPTMMITSLRKPAFVIS